jgi:hypothetical protein
MSDDFLNDVSSAIDNGGAIPQESSAPVINTAPQPAEQQKPQNVVPQKDVKTSVEDELSSMFEANDPHKEQEVKAKVPTQKVVENDHEDGGEEFQGTPRPRSPKSGQEKLLDTFLDEDEHGNLVNKAGEVIALAGKSRTYYEGMKSEARKQRQAANDLAVSNMQLSQQFKSLYDEYKGMSENGASPIQSIVKETGFSDKEAQEAVSLMQQYKRDPLSAIKNLLTQAKMSGIDVSKIGANISVDPAYLRQSMKELIDEQMGPISRNAEQDTAEKAATRQATEFLQQYPEAERFGSSIADAKMRFPQMSLSEIWLRLRREIEKNSQTSPRPVTKHRKEPARRTSQRPAKVLAPFRDYSKMSFAEIANSIKEDNS